jgi:hypothetical protein
VKAATDRGGKVIALYVAYLLLGFRTHTRVWHTHTHTDTRSCVD